MILNAKGRQAVWIQFDISEYWYWMFLIIRWCGVYVDFLRELLQNDTQIKNYNDDMTQVPDK